MKNKIEFLTDQMGHRWEKFEAKELTHHVWDRFKAKKTPTWYWNKYNVDTEQTFFWNKHAVKVNQQYTWHRYQKIDELIRTDYYWDKHNIKHTPKYPSWMKSPIDSDPTYIWKQHQAEETELPAGEESAIEFTYENSYGDGNIDLYYLSENKKSSGIWAIPCYDDQRPVSIEAPPKGKVPVYDDGYTAYAGIGGNAHTEISDSAPNQFVESTQGYERRFPGDVVEGSGTFIPRVLISSVPDGQTFSKLGNLIIEVALLEDRLIKSNQSWFNAPRTTLKTFDVSAIYGKYWDKSSLIPEQDVHNQVRYEINNDIDKLIKANGPVVVMAYCVRDNGFKLSYSEGLSGTVFYKSNPPKSLTDTPYIVTYVKHDVVEGITHSYSVQLRRDYNDENSTFYVHYYYQPFPETYDEQYYKRALTYEYPGKIIGIGPTNGQTSGIIEGYAINESGEVVDVIVGKKVKSISYRLPPAPPYRIVKVRDIPTGVTTESITIKNTSPKITVTLAKQAQSGSSQMTVWTYPFKGSFKYYQKGSPTGVEVRSKDRAAYPDDGFKDGYWYVYDRQQVTFLYYIQSMYMKPEEIANLQLTQLAAKPTLNRDTGFLTYTTGPGSDFYIYAGDDPAAITRWIQKLPDGAGLYWNSIPNDQSLVYEFGDYVGAQYLDSQYFQDTSIVLEIVDSAGTFIETLTTNTPDSYPLDGIAGDYWFIRTKTEPIIEIKQGNYIDDVMYLDQLYYPQNGPMDGYWYVYVGKTPLYSPGQKEGMVKSKVSTDYPANGRANGQWYIYDHNEYIDYKGQYIETVSSTAGQDAYPNDGIQGYYWYVSSDFKIVITKEEWIQEVDTTDKDAYPNDGAAGEYWYVHKREYTQTDPVFYLEDVWDTTDSAYPNNGVQNGYWYKYVGNRYIPKYIIGDSLLKGGVKYKQDINTSEDYAPGDVGCAEIQFTIFTEPKEAQKYLDLECEYLYRMNDADGWTRVGHFVVTEASDKTATTTKLKAYDNIIKTETVVDELINNRQLWPMPLSTLFTRLCDYCGVASRWDNSAINRDFNVPNNFTTSNISARQILALVAEVAAGFIKAEPDGTIVIRGYQDNAKIFTKRNYIDVTKAIYNTQDIDKINIAKSTDDLGVSYGSGHVVYRIIDNPLLYIQDEHEIDTQMQNIFRVISQVRFTPTEMSVYDPGAIETGDIVTVDGDTAYIMSIEWDGSKVKVEAKGQRERTVEKNPIDGSIDDLRGKSNELKRTLEETNSRITDVEAGLRSEISQTATQIRATIQSTKEGLESQITQTASSLTAEIKNTKEGLESQLALTEQSLNATISDTKKELEGQLSLTAEQFQTSIDDTKKELHSEITQTADSITSSITSQGQTITEISQRLDGIKLTYNSSNGTASITIGDITVSNLVNGEYVNNTVAGIDMTGYVRFNDLERSGATTINGANITTGQIDADRINLTGAISFSDLNSSLQAQISGGSGGGTTDPVTGLPDYIKSTYIDATTIYSPRIVGGKLIAGDSSRGYSEMTSGGLNICASNGSKPIIGLGHLTEHYNEPFITLGVGVDDYGTDAGLIKKYGSGLWIGDNDDINGTGSTPGSGTGIFINFAQGRIYKYINGTATAL